RRRCAAHPWATARNEPSWPEPSARAPRAVASSRRSDGRRAVRAARCSLLALAGTDGVAVAVAVAVALAHIRVEPPGAREALVRAGGGRVGLGEFLAGLGAGAPGARGPLLGGRAREVGIRRGFPRAAPDVPRPLAP